MLLKSCHTSYNMVDAYINKYIYIYVYIYTIFIYLQRRSRKFCGLMITWKDC